MPVTQLAQRMRRLVLALKSKAQHDGLEHLHKEAAEIESDLSLLNSYRSLVDIVDTIISRFDRNHRHLFVSQAIERVTNRKPEEFIGKTNRELGMPPDLCDQWDRAIDEVFTQQKAIPVIFEFPSPTMGRVFFEARFAPEFAADGTVAAVVCVAFDVTESHLRQREIERLKAELEERQQELQHHTRLFEGIASTTPDFIYVFNLQGQFLYANRRLLEVWGRKLPDIVGKTCLELGYEQWHHDMHMREIAQVIETKKPLKGEVPFRAPLTGIFGIYEYIFTPVIGPDGEVELIAGTTRDVTENRQMETALRTSEERRNLALHATRDGIWDYNPITKEYVWSDRLTGMLGYGSDEIPHTVEAFNALLHPEDLPRIWAAVEKYLRRENETYQIEFRLRHKDGSYRWILSRGMAIFDDAGNPTRFVGAHTDITDLKRARESAEAANRSKDQFLAVLSHELRTPLTPVLLSVAGMEAEPGLPPQVREELAMIRQSIALETRLIDDLLDLSRIVNGKMVLHPQSLAVHPLLKSVVDLLVSEFKDKQVTVRWRLTATHDRITGDSARLHQVFWNLMKNALKFTNPGGAVTVTTTNPSPGDLQISVHDTGVGIESAAIPKVFDAFEQGEHGANRQFGGLGLGLAISKAIIDMHEGRIHVSSPGKDRGATFEVNLRTIPIPAHHESQRGDAYLHAGNSMKPLHLLLVEDNEPTLRTLRRLLERSGHRVTPAASVSAALRVAQHDTFDLLVSDIGLPDGTGLDLMQKLRSTGHTMPGIALTGFGMDSDVHNSLAAGFTAHLTKPVDLAQLESTIRRVASAS